MSLGAEKTVAWSHTNQLSNTLKKLRASGMFLLALEQDPRSTPLFHWQFPEADHAAAQDYALCVGNEVRGLSKLLLTHMDAILEIPMRGAKESLNVAVATGIALFVLQHKGV